jgi:protein required for attachment to host cells
MGPDASILEAMHLIIRTGSRTACLCLGRQAVKIASEGNLPRRRTAECGARAIGFEAVSGLRGGASSDLNTWIVVCDGTKTMILKIRGTRSAPSPCVGKSASKPIRAQVSWEPIGQGGSLASTGEMRSAADQTDWHEQPETAFLRELTHAVHAAVASGAAKHWCWRCRRGRLAWFASAGQRPTARRSRQPAGRRDRKALI